MKLFLRLFALILFLCSAAGIYAQNVGINESNPGAKLTVKAGSAFSPSLLVKNFEDDSSLMIRGNYLYAGNANAGTSYNWGSVMTIANRYSSHADATLLNLLATGQKTDVNANGSLSSMTFSNSNYTGRFLITASNNPGEGLISITQNEAFPQPYKHLMYLYANGRAGFGTYNPQAAMQINHRASEAQPTLLLSDSSATSLPTMQFKNLDYPNRFWQISGVSSATESGAYFDFATQTGIKMSLSGIGNLGIGDISPEEKLVVQGNIKLSGEVNKTATGTANLVPVCYGNITSGGLLQSGASTDNFTVTKTATGRYNITITGESFNINSYQAVASTIGSTPSIITLGSGSGILNVYTFNVAGVAADAGFCFTVYKK